MFALNVQGALFAPAQLPLGRVAACPTCRSPFTIGQPLLHPPLPIESAAGMQPAAPAAGGFPSAPACRTRRGERNRRPIPAPRRPPLAAFSAAVARRANANRTNRASKNSPPAACSAACCRPPLFWAPLWAWQDCFPTAQDRGSDRLRDQPALDRLGAGRPARPLDDWPRRVGRRSGLLGSVHGASHWATCSIKTCGAMRRCNRSPRR